MITMLALLQLAVLNHTQLMDLVVVTYVFLVFFVVRYILSSLIDLELQLQ
jgi:hypothetical protein